MGFIHLHEVEHLARLTKRQGLGKVFLLEHTKTCLYSGYVSKWFIDNVIN